MAAGVATAGRNRPLWSARRAAWGAAVSTPLQRYRDGEPGAEDEALRKYAAHALALARTMLPDFGAGAAARDGLLDALRAPAGAFAGRANELSVVMGFVRGRCLQALGVVPGNGAATAPDTDTRWQSVMAALTPAQVRAAIEALPQEERDVLLPAVMCARPLAVIARGLDVDNETARRSLRLALQHLRDAVSDAAETGAP